MIAPLFSVEDEVHLNIRLERNRLSVLNERFVFPGPNSIDGRLSQQLVPFGDLHAGHFPRPVDVEMEQNRSLNALRLRLGRVRGRRAFGQFEVISAVSPGCPTTAMGDSGAPARNGKAQTATRVDAARSGTTPAIARNRRFETYGAPSE